MAEHDVYKTPLSKSLRKHIRERKQELRENHGEGSDKYREFLAWVRKKREEKALRQNLG